MTLKIKVSRDWYILNKGIEMMRAESMYSKKFGEIKGWQLSWLGYHFLGGKHKIEHFAAFIEGFKSGTSWVREISSRRKD